MAKNFVHCFALASSLWFLIQWNSVAEEPRADTVLLLKGSQFEIRFDDTGYVPFSPYHSGSRRSFEHCPKLQFKLVGEQKYSIVNASCRIVDLSIEDSSPKENASKSTPICSFGLQEGQVESVYLSPKSLHLFPFVEPEISERPIYCNSYPQYALPSNLLEECTVKVRIDTRCSLENGQFFKSITTVRLPMQLPTEKGIEHLLNMTRGLMAARTLAQDQTLNLRALLSLPFVQSRLSHDELMHCVNRLGLRIGGELRGQLLQMLAAPPIESIEHYRRLIDQMPHIAINDLYTTHNLWHPSFEEPLLAQFEDIHSARGKNRILDLLERNLDHPAQMPRSRLTAALRHQGLIASPELERPPSPTRMRSTKIPLATPFRREAEWKTTFTQKINSRDLCSILARAGDLSTIPILSKILNDRGTFGVFHDVQFKTFPATRPCDHAHDAISKMLGLNLDAAIGRAYRQLGLKNALAPSNPSNYRSRYEIYKGERKYLLEREEKKRDEDSEQVITGTTLSTSHFIDAKGEILAVRNQMLDNLIEELPALVNQARESEVNRGL